MSAIIGFAIIMMVGFLIYMGYRLLYKRDLYTLLCLSFQIFVITIAISAFFLNVLTNNLTEILYIAFGMLLPGVFFTYDIMNIIRSTSKDKTFKRFIYSIIVLFKEAFENLNKRKDFNKVLIEGTDSTEVPKDYIGFFKSGLALYKKGCTEKAIEYIKKACVLKEDFYDGYYQLGVIYNQNNRQKEAVESFSEAIKLNENLIKAYNALAMVYYEQGKIDEALYIYSKGLEINPNEYSFYFNMGITLSERGNYGEAVKAYKKALDKKKDENEIYYYLAATLIELKRYEEAVEAYKNALTHKPSDCDLYYNLSIVYSLLRKKEIAIYNLKRAIEINSDFKEEAKQNSAFDYIKSNTEFKRLVC